MLKSISIPTKGKAPKRGGIALGWSKDLKKIYYNAKDTHSLIIGTTRSGKSRHVVLPSVGLTAMTGESMVLVDPKSELYLYTKLYLQMLGTDQSQSLASLPCF